MQYALIFFDVQLILAQMPHPPIPMRPGPEERRACEDIRRSPVPVLAHCDGAPGLVGTPSLGPTRTEEDVEAHRARTVASAPAVTRWPLVADHLTMHQAARLVRLVAEHDGMTDDLGQKGTRGLLRSMATRAAFLADPTPRLVLHSTPQQAAWMNQMEIGFRLLVRQLLKRASGTSGQDVHARLLAFVEYCHTTMAQPFQWAYGQKPLYI